MLDLTTKSAMYILLGMIFFVSAILAIVICIEKRRIAAAMQRRRRLQEEADRNATGEQLLRRLMRQAIQMLLTHKVVNEGIPLASSFGVLEVMADRELRSNRNRGRPPRLTMADGTRDTITGVVRRARAAGPLPDSPPGPALMELLEALRERQQREAATQPFSESDRTPLEELIDGLVKAEEEVRSAEIEKEMETFSDPNQAYGVAAPYTPNPANKCIRYVMSSGKNNASAFAS
ncbi:unnamed protein product [Trypanosoma congolense IL3000]|uniref:WGS project CAEQ00000000 data, annotated contig 2301 n=1 Tax=Trypanosoma congolense (strain IL3000) TaxID=1068625 RepID=F9WK16_TRYCI|nr:unnamed protein product [Trypanosoma congolense IL3000]CCD17677.1 unnamed protein product [Trypanosoma congolense IL3000]